MITRRKLGHLYLCQRVHPDSWEKGITVTVFCNEVSAFVKRKRKAVVDERFNRGTVHATRSQVKNETQDIFFSK